MEKQLVKDKYLLVTNKGLKGKEQKRIIILGDLHVNSYYENRFGKPVLKLLYNYLEESNDVDAILVVGDNVMGAKSYKNQKTMSTLNYILSMLSEKAPTLISKGNHDLFLNDDEIAKLFKSLEKINNVYALDNEQVKLDGVTYTGFSPRHDAYGIMNYGAKANNMFVEDYQNANFKYEDNELNIALIHDPITVSSKEALQVMDNDLRNISLIASGHLHNGFIPTKIGYKLQDRLQDKGFWESPLTGFKIDTCRGAYFLGKGIKSTVILPEKEATKIINGLNEEDKALLVVTKGISKYPLTPWGGDPNITEVTLMSDKAFEDENEIKYSK